MSHRFRQICIAFLSLAVPLSASLAVAIEPAVPADGDMLNSIERVRTVMRGMIETEVRAVLRDARAHGDRSRGGHVVARRRVGPGAGCAELNPADRDRLLAYLFAASREASRRSSSTHMSAVHGQEVQAEQRRARAASRPDGAPTDHRKPTGA